MVVSGTTADGSAIMVFLLLPGVMSVDEIVMMSSSLLVAWDNLEETQRKSGMAMRTNFIVLGCY